MNFEEADQAIQNAEVTLRFADRIANKLARLLVGRLRKVESYGTLRALKRELQDFNANTQTWKENQ